VSERIETTITNPIPAGSLQLSEKRDKAIKYLNKQQQQNFKKLSVNSAK
jgi:hypothetical protein